MNKINISYINSENELKNQWQKIKTFSNNLY